MKYKRLKALSAAESEKSESVTMQMTVGAQESAAFQKYKKKGQQDNKTQIHLQPWPIETENTDGNDDDPE